jgi:hypothetical protein
MKTCGIFLSLEDLTIYKNIYSVLESGFLA